MSQEWRAQLSSKFRKGWPDLLIVLALLALFALVHRFVEAVEIGGDAISKWHFVRQWSYNNDFAHAKWDQHQARMGVNAFTWLVQKVFGRSWRAYYVGPLFMAAVQLPFAYALGRRLGGRGVGILAALFITFLAAVHRSASQLLPDGFAGTDALIAAYLFARFAEAEHERERWRWLLSVTAVAFLGYLTKETFFFFYPGFVIGLWLVRRRVRDVAIFCGGLLLGLGLETLAYRLFTDYGSRLAIVRGTHGKGGGDEEPLVIGWSQLAKPITALDGDWHLLLGLALVGALLLLSLRRRAPRGLPLARLVVLLALSHVVLLTLSTQAFQNPLPRYMDPVVPFAALCAAGGVGIALVALFSLKPLAKLGDWGPLTRFGPAAGSEATALWTLAAVAVMALLVYRQQRASSPFDGWTQGAMIAELGAHTYDRNLPILAPNASSKTLMTLYQVYLDDARLARDGRLPNYNEAKHRYQNLAYIVKDPRAYRRNTFRRLLDARCVLQLRRGSRGRGTRGFVDTELTHDLPPTCDALLASLVAANAPD